MLRTVAVLTGGGDVPGLNVVLKTLSWRLADEGVRVFGLRRGWSALLEARGPDDEEWVLPLTRERTRKIDRFGGTVLHSSRTNPAAHEGVDRTADALATLERLGVDALVAIGGDDTLSFARRLHEEGFPVAGVPKTMDNDVYGTELCVGFSTAVSRSVNMITDLRTPAGSHERVLVVELFGRYSGETSLAVARLAGAERALISEVPFDPERVAALLREDRTGNPSRYAIVTVSEGAKPEGGAMIQSGEPDAYGHRKLGGIGHALGEMLRERGLPVMIQSLAYLMRSGAPDALDRMLAMGFAGITADQLLAGRSGDMAAVREGSFSLVSLAESGRGTRKVDVERSYDRERYRPKSDGVLGRPVYFGC